MADRTFLFDRPALDRIATRPEEEHNWEFDGGGLLGDGIFKLYARISVGKVGVLAARRFTGSTCESVPAPSGSSVSLPALAVLGDHLYSAHTGLDHRIRLDRFDGTSWTPLGTLGWQHETMTAPALAAHNGRLWVGHSDPQGRIWVTPTPNGTSWPTHPKHMSGSTTRVSPALGVFNGRLQLVHTGLVRRFWIAQQNTDGATWTGFSHLPVMGSMLAPVLQGHGNRLYIAYIGGEAQTYTNYTDGSGWKTPLSLGGKAEGPAALGMYQGAPRCTVRGLGANGMLWLSLVDRAAYQAVPGTENAGTPGAIAEYRGHLYTLYSTTRRTALSRLAGQGAATLPRTQRFGGTPGRPPGRAWGWPAAPRAGDRRRAADAEVGCRKRCSPGTDEFRRWRRSNLRK
ncbi:hypothetical protein AB0P12_32260 [Streptomyces subrutilus]|uniref:hypothetical protein n=1 Tax=Streptomyces subrutilus TaxID=36818 RepID=UPI003421979B